MYKCFFVLALSSLIAQMPPALEHDNKKIAIDNMILTKVNDTTISVVDVNKKLDLLFHQNYPHLTHSSQALFQFYENGWRPTLMQMIDHELILSDAAAREIKLSDGEIREEMESRFGPNVFATLDEISISYEEAWKMVKNDLIVQRMNWWFIQSKAIQSVTPQDIREAYRSYLDQNPPYQEIKYQVISIHSANPDLIEKVYALVSKESASPEALVDSLKQVDDSIQISSEYTVKDIELSDAHRTALAHLTPKTYSHPVAQKSRVNQKSVVKIFYLSEKTDYPAPSFSDLSPKLKNDLIQQSVGKQSVAYLEKLRKQYGFDPAHIKEQLPEDMHPFSLQ